jgi:hypothetical protein
MDLGSIPQGPEHEAPRRRGGLWRGLKFVLGAPVQALGTDQIVKGAGVIGDLAAQIKAGPRADPRVHVDEGHHLDLETMAFVQGVSVAEIHRLLANRRRQTARAVLCCLCGGGGFLALWLTEAFMTPVYSCLAYVIGLLTICTAMFLSAFYNALVNWQIRTRRLGTALEFLRTEESWWPS